MSPVIHRRTATSLVVALMLAALIPATAMAATRPTTFSLSLGDTCVAGRASDNAAVKLVWRRANGNLVAKTTVTASVAGNWSFCSSAKVTKVGDRIQATVAGTTHTVVIPLLTFKVDRANDVYRGKARAGSRLLLWYHAGIFADYYASATFRARADGTFSYKPYSDYELDGGIEADLRWRNAAGDHVWLHDLAPYFRVTIGRPSFSGGTRPFSRVEISVRDSSTMALKATGKAIAGEFAFSGQFKDVGGNRVSLAVGDRLIAPSIASDADWVVPNIQGSANVATEVVSGTCADGSQFVGVEIKIVRSGVTRGYALGDVEPDGSFEVSFTGRPAPWYEPANIKHGDRITVSCRHATGDWAGLKFIVP